MDTALQIRQDGASKGLCQTYQELLTEGLPVQRLSTLFFRGVDFCIGNDFPTLNFLRAQIGNKAEEYGFYIDNMHVTEVNRKKLALNGECHARVFYDNFTVSKIYVRHQSSAQIYASGRSIVTIDAFDDARLTIIAAGDAKVFVYLYGQSTCQYVGHGIKVVLKERETY